MPAPILRPQTATLRSPIGYDARKRQGFALIITLILMSMMVLLMVSMATLTRVETQIAANYQQADAARHNALTALNIAIGQLQAAAGPDQRVTARAEILDSDPTTSAIESVNQPYWTAAWTTDNASLDLPFNAAQRATSTGETFTMTPAAKSAAASAKATAWMVSKPTSSTVLDARTYTGTTTGTTPDAVVLARQIGPSSNNVVAPLVPISVRASQLPGFSSTDSTPTAIGAYAYWIADEGVKAKINLAPDAASGDPSAATANRTLNQRHFLAPATFAAEQALDPLFRGSFPVGNAEKLPKLLQSASVEFVTVPVNDNGKAKGFATHTLGLARASSKSLSQRAYSRPGRPLGTQTALNGLDLRVHEGAAA